MLTGNGEHPRASGEAAVVSEATRMVSFLPQKRRSQAFGQRTPLRSADAAPRSASTRKKSWATCSQTLSDTRYYS